jgi:DNA-binding transcriptional ArsR family regulator
MKPTDYSSLLTNKVLKERARLLILSFLLASDTNGATFMTLQKALDLSKGNLSVQIKILEEAGYVSIQKEFMDNKPRTTVFITKNGIVTLKNYLKEMKLLVQSAEDQQ